MSPQQRHEDVVRRYPGGLTPAQFRHEALASADSDGKLDPPALADWFTRQSLLIGMWMDGLIELRGRGRDQPMWPWFITEKGRASITSPTHPSPSQEDPDRTEGKTNG